MEDQDELDEMLADLFSKEGLLEKPSKEHWAVLLDHSIACGIKLDDSDESIAAAPSNK